MVATIGAFVIALSILVFIVNAWKTQRSGVVAGPDPWDGRTLEWMTSSPPPVYDFAVVPTVHGRDELWLRKHGDGHGGAPPPREPLPRSEDLAAIHMPPPSYWPVVLAAAITVMLAGLLISYAQVVVGGLLTLWCMYKFAMEYHRLPEAVHS
jgi:heme/copper-type cytochrome/quinol oxidase subunit 1